MLPVTSLAAVALSVLFTVLTLHVIQNRRRERVAVGSGSETLVRAIRAQGNFCETVPLTLILLALAEANRTPTLLLAALALALVAGRGLHAYSITQAEPRGSIRLRVVGMTLTFSVVGLLAAAIVVMLALGTAA